MKQDRVLVGLGEILWDVFASGPRFGGAPANFACSAAGLATEAFEVHIAGAVGNDTLGTQARKALLDHHVKTDALSIVDYPTGQVLVSLDGDGHASYEFAANSAWDHLEWSDILESVAKTTDVVCWGTLGQRSEISKQTIRRFVASTPTHALRILDINLRSPFWNQEIIHNSLAMANVLKLNETELPVVSEMLEFAGSELDVMRQIMSKYSLQVVALTRGANGSVLIRDDNEHSEVPGLPTTVIDTVGAGDSFTACLALGLLQGLTLDAINRWASQVAAFVCSQPGATPELPSHLRMAQQSFA